MKQKLTIKSLDALPTNAKRYEVRDTATAGLLIRISSKKVWYYSCRIEAKRRRIRIGTYPTISLTEARSLVREIQRDIELGTFEKVDDAASQPKQTLGEIIPLFIERYAKRYTKGWMGTHSVLQKFDCLFSKPIDEITRGDIVKVLDDIVANGTPIRANRALAAIKKLMNWCVDRDMLAASPVTSLRPPTREVSRDRVLSNDELKAIWGAGDIEGFPFGPFVQILMLTGQRRGEVSGMRWAEIDFDERTWTLPAKRVKNGRLHVVPLSSLVIDILQSVPKFLHSEFVFTTNGRTSISGFGRFKKRIDQALPDHTEDWRFHDLRRTASTGMAKMEILPHVIDAVTNHKSGIVSGVGATYNRYTYFNEKREALEKWSMEIAKML